MKKTLPHFNITRSSHFFLRYDRPTRFMLQYLRFFFLKKKTRVISQLRLTTTSLNTERERRDGGTGAEEENYHILDIM